MTLEFKNNSVAEHCCDFMQGLESLKEDALENALFNFQRAYETAPFDDIYHNKYASYCGLARVLNGDHGGVELCRDAASLEMMDGDVFLNLACAEWHMNSRQRAISVLEKGLQIDQQHPGLNKFQSNVGVRKKTAIEFIPRNSFLNNALGKLVRKKSDCSGGWTVQEFL